MRTPDGAFVFAPYDLTALEDAGIEWAFLAEEARPLRPDLLRGIDGLYHTPPRVTKASLEGRRGRLAIIARNGVGLDFVEKKKKKKKNVPACSERGIAVTITPSGVTHSMASAAVTLVLAAAHRLRQRDHRADGRATGAPARYLPHGAALQGRTLGVIGYGRIGREVVRLLEPWESGCGWSRTSGHLSRSPVSRTWRSTSYSQSRTWSSSPARSPTRLAGFSTPAASV